MTKNEFGVFEVNLPNLPDGSPAIPHGSRVKIHLKTQAGEWVDRIPAWIKFAVQAPGEIPFNGIYYDPPPEEAYVFKHPRPKQPQALRIYECHVGMSSPEPKISTYNEFREHVLPRVAKLGYNAIQIMAIQEHAYYASFGYHVTNFFAISSRCGTPEELKAMIDRAHELGLYVLMDCVHSHASSNCNDGINMLDGSDSHYFHSGARGYHWMWDSRLFNYGHWEVRPLLGPWASLLLSSQAHTGESTPHQCPLALPHTRTHARPGDAVSAVQSALLPGGVQVRRLPLRRRDM